MGNYQISKKQILTIAVLIILTAGLFVSVYLVQKQQIFKSKASQELQNAFEITMETELSNRYLGREN